jgi:hypothetical protein
MVMEKVNRTEEEDSIYIFWACESRDWLDSIGRDRNQQDNLCSFFIVSFSVLYLRMYVYLFCFLSCGEREREREREQRCCCCGVMFCCSHLSSIFLNLLWAWLAICTRLFV